jgi:hypothetical protein
MGEPGAPSGSAGSQDAAFVGATLCELLAIPFNQKREASGIVSRGLDVAHSWLFRRGRKPPFDIRSDHYAHTSPARWRCRTGLYCEFGGTASARARSGRYLGVGQRSVAINVERILAQPNRWRPAGIELAQHADRCRVERAGTRDVMRQRMRKNSRVISQGGQAVSGLSLG